MGVYDGHGRELGELASAVARDTFQVRWARHSSGF